MSRMPSKNDGAPNPNGGETAAAASAAAKFSYEQTFPDHLAYHAGIKADWGLRG